MVRRRKEGALHARGSSSIRAGRTSVVVTSEFPLVPITLNYRRHNRADTASAPLLDGYRRSLSRAFTAVVIDTVFRPCRTLAHVANTVAPLCHCVRTMLHAAQCAGKLAPLNRRDKQIHQSETGTAPALTLSLRPTLVFYLAKSQLGYYFPRIRDVPAFHANPLATLPILSGSRIRDNEKIEERDATTS